MILYGVWLVRSLLFAAEAQQHNSIILCNRSGARESTTTYNDSNIVRLCLICVGLCFKLLIPNLAENYRHHQQKSGCNVAVLLRWNLLRSDIYLWLLKLEYQSLCVRFFNFHPFAFLFLLTAHSITTLS